MPISIEQIIRNNRDQVVHHHTHCLTMHKTFTVLRLKCGTTYVETRDIDDEKTETVEILFRHNPGPFKLISRSRSGENYNPMRPYSRDSQFPLLSNVVI